MSNNIYSVSQINEYIEKMFQDDFMLSNLSITGEVSNCKYNHTGHIYFTLKDEKSAMSCVMFAGNRLKGLGFNMKDGDKVVLTGYVGVYSVAGKYQFYAKKIELAGLGNLYAQFEKLKVELEEKGMFDDMYKKPIPKYANRIGVVTASTGAAVHDIIQVSKRRNPFVEIILAPAQVQGQGAAESIISAINQLDVLGLDVIIVGRGGGSIEDLWAFNEQPVAMAIFNASTPIISAVGHETDFTIADFVADKRAATPSQAAEMANYLYDDLANTLVRYSDRYNLILDSKISLYEERLLSIKKRLYSLKPENKLRLEEERLHSLYEKLQSEMENVLSRYENKMSLLTARVESASPAKKIVGGFGFVTKDKKAVDSIEVIENGDLIRTILHDGYIDSTVVKIVKTNNIGELDG